VGEGVGSVNLEKLKEFFIFNYTSTMSDNGADYGPYKSWTKIPRHLWWKENAEVKTLDEIRKRSGLNFCDWLWLGNLDGKSVNYHIIPHQAGIYIWGIRIAEQIIPIYAGKASSLHERCIREIKCPKDGPCKVINDIKSKGDIHVISPNIYITYIPTFDLHEQEKVILMLYNFVGNIQDNLSYRGDSPSFINYIRSEEYLLCQLMMIRDDESKINIPPVIILPPLFPTP
jgi:hypothetical protein